MFDTLINSERPQTTIWWLRKKPGVGAVLLGQMARGEVPITHDTFRGLPQDLAHGYLRHLLAAVGVLEPFDPYIERMGPWLEGFLDTVPEHHREVLRLFGRWHVMKQMRHSASVGRLSRGTADAARHRVRIASKVLAYFDGLGVTAQTATQANLDHYVQSRGRLCGEHGFIRWLRTTGVNPKIRLPTQPQRPEPAVPVGEDHRWELVDQLLHDPNIKPYTRIGGLFTLLFAQRMADIVAMKTSQISHADGLLHVTFNNTAIAMPPPLDNLIASHLTERGMSLHASRDTGWLFPGGSPGRHIATENIRKQLVAIGLKPYEGRKATLFQLAADIPAPVLGDLIGISHKNAADWARLAARDWRSYIAERDR